MTIYQQSRVDISSAQVCAATSGLSITVWADVGAETVGIQ